MLGSQTLFSRNLISTTTVWTERAAGTYGIRIGSPVSTISTSTDTMWTSKDRVGSQMLIRVDDPGTKNSSLPGRGRHLHDRRGEGKRRTRRRMKKGRRRKRRRIRGGCLVWRRRRGGKWRIGREVLTREKHHLLFPPSGEGKGGGPLESSNRETSGNLLEATFALTPLADSSLSFALSTTARRRMTPG